MSETRTIRELELNKLSLGTLYSECRSKGIRTSPTKDELIKLLLDFEEGHLVDRAPRRHRATKAEMAARVFEAAPAQSPESTQGEYPPDEPSVPAVPADF